MPRAKRIPKNRIPAMDVTTRAYLFDENGSWQHDAATAFRLEYDDRGFLGKVWAIHGPAVLVGWVRERPGTRPSTWWRLEAPEPRRRTGGTGDLCSDCLAYGETYHKGIPVHHVTVRELRTWPSLWNRRHGRPALAVDPDDPPRYESEAAFLRRLDLLAPGEEGRVPAESWTEDEVLVGQDAGL